MFLALQVGKQPAAAEVPAAAQDKPKRAVVAAEASQGTESVMN